MSDEEHVFTVKDRRHFSADGSVRTEEETRAAVVEPAPAKQAEKGGVTGPDPEPGPEGPVDFVGFLVSLAGQASVALQEPTPDLRRARSIVSILEMLRDKTEGRRTPDEDRLLGQILYELRMAYVSRAGAVGA